MILHFQISTVESYYVKLKKVKTDMNQLEERLEKLKVNHVAVEIIGS